MASDYTEYLAANVLNEQQLVSYRSLGRALKVHNNLAKQMLFDFYRKQNSKKPGSVYATYMIAGTTHNAANTNGVHKEQDGDTIMQSSPLPSSPPEHSQDHDIPISTRAVLLVREEQLEGARAAFDKITSIHIYSLQAKGISDMQTLKECNRHIATAYATEDPLKDWKQYGTIQNPNAKRRARKGGPPPAPAPITKPAAKATPAVQTTSNESTPAAKPAAKSTTSKPAATTSKKEASSLFKSFAKAKPPAKKKPANETEDEPMHDFSDEGEDTEGSSALPESAAASGDEKASKEQSTRAERKAKLAAMMDIEDEPMEDAATEPETEEKKDDFIDQPAAAAPEPKETVTVENGRRRGRRKVMKKKTVKDEDGYLVTREEAAWESFSEDEPAPKKPKPTPAASTGGKKGAAKTGQGNIMSFFGKK